MPPVQLLLPTAADTPFRLIVVARSLHHALRRGETPMVELIRPTGSTRTELATMARGHWQEIGAQAFEALWTREAEDALARLDTSRRSRRL